MKNVGRSKASVSAEQQLRRHGVIPTSQRVRIAEVLFARHAHWSAEEVYEQVNRTDRSVSRATVYNTLGLLVDKGLLRQVIVDPAKVFYDSNIRPHHHLFDVDSGELTDVERADVSISALPELPPGKKLEGLDLIIRVRNRS
jgi:Fur family iron response transcriptional regulator